MMEIYVVFKTFIESKKRDSKRTASEYERRILEFFHFQIGKDISEVDVKEVKQIKPVDVQVFVNTLLAKGNANSTIQTKLRSLKSFFKELKRNGIRVNDDIFDVKLKKKKKHYDALLNMNEVENLYEFAKGRPSCPLEQYLFIKSLFITANRKSAMQELTWSDIKKKYDYNTGQQVWVIEVVDKGDKTVVKPIVEEFYNELLQLRETESNNEKVFKNITEDIIRGTMGAFSKKLDDGRKICVHGIKSSALTIAWKMTKDIKKVQQLGSHESMSTTEIYIREEESYFEQLSYILGKKIDFEKIKSLSHEELLEIVMNNEEIRFAVATKLN